MPPASPAVRARIMGLLCRSIAAANAFPDNLRAVFACVYGGGTTLRLKQAGMELAVWVFKHADARPLAAAAPAVLRGLLDMLDDGARRNFPPEPLWSPADCSISPCASSDCACGARRRPP